MIVREAIKTENAMTNRTQEITVIITSNFKCFLVMKFIITLSHPYEIYTEEVTFST